MDKERDVILEEELYGINAVAKEVVFCAIPKFWELRKARIEAEKKFDSEESLKLERAKKLLEDMSDIATGVFETEFSVTEINSELPLESLHALCAQVMHSSLQKMPFFVKMKRANKFKKDMQKSFGITTDKKEPFDIFQELVAKYSSKYMQLFEGMGDKYYNEVTKRKSAEAEAENYVVVMLKKIPTRELGTMWENGDEEEAYRNCLQIMIEYQAYAKNIEKSEVKELTYDFEHYDEEQEEWVKVNRGVINVENISSSMS